MGAQYRTDGDVAVITIDNPPVNGFSYTLRRELSDGLDRAETDPDVIAIVLVGGGTMFSGGADIREFQTPLALAEPNLLSLIRRLESCPKPVVVALHGVCMGGGLETAMGAHYRVAAPGTSIGLPEVKLGVLPGAGGTQRLPRAIGVEAALNMIVTGEPVKSEVLAGLPGQRLLDRIVDGDLVAGACTFARERAAEQARTGAPLPRIRDLAATHPYADGYFHFARHTAAGMSRGLPAPAKCVDAVEASTKRCFDDGTAYERELFRGLLETSESKALRHVFFAERAAARIPDVPEDTPQRRVDAVAVIGAGTMGTGITINFLNAGLPVTLLEAKQDALDRGVASIRSIYGSQIKKGTLTQDACDQRLARLTTTVDYTAIRNADVVIEAVFEDMAVKESVFRQLDANAKPGAILATNTSTLDVNAIARCTRRPQDVVGMHFFSPANVMKLLEVVRGDATANDALATVMALARRIRKTAVVSGVCDGFIGNRMIDQYGRQAGFLLDEGCSPQQVDRAIEKFGFAMGIFRMMDLAGNDIGWAVRKRRYVERPDVRYSRSGDRLCELGRFGQKTGAGWYDYVAGKRDALTSAVVTEMLETHRRELGIAARRVADDEIVRRLLWALVNEGARILEERIASRASDIDVVYVSGYGFPLQRGGPMHYADSVGLYNVVQDMKRFARNPHADPAFWTPAPLLARLAAEGKTFSGVAS